MTAGKVPSWFERLLMPQLNEIKGELKAIHTQIESLEERMDTRIDSLRNETKSEFTGLNYRFETIDAKLDSIEKRIPVIEEIAALKLRMAELEKKLATA